MKTKKLDLFSISSIALGVNVSTVLNLLEFFTSLCIEPLMRDWIGGKDGSLFWLPLLTLLAKPQQTSEQSPRKKQKG